MKICIVGAGYVGLVTGACFADSGNDVICVDSDAPRVEKLSAGDVPIYEPGLAELIRRNQKGGRLSFSTDLADGVGRSLMTFIAVGTPQGPGGAADLSAVEAVARAIGEAMRARPGYRIIVTKSTVPVGTGDRIAEIIRGLTDEEFDVVSNPEFLKEGAALEDFQKPDRVVIGTDNVRVAELLKELYSPFVRTGNPILVMDRRSAEITKYAANALLATRISFINEIANLCDALGADVEQVRQGMGTDRRIGHHFLFPGAGYGGSCFPKDIRALVHRGREVGVTLLVPQAVNDANENQKRVLLEKILAHFDHADRGKAVTQGRDMGRSRKVAVWGLAFKARTDDLREAPALVLVNGLLEAGFEVAVHDPEALAGARAIFGSRVAYHERNYDALAGAHALAIVTEWGEYRRPDLERMKSLMAEAVIFDGRNVLSAEAVRRAGFKYQGIGRR